MKPFAGHTANYPSDQHSPQFLQYIVDLAESQSECIEVRETKTKICVNEALGVRELDRNIRTAQGAADAAMAV